MLGRIAFLTASVRDRLSADTWRILNQLQNDFPPTPAQFNAGAVVGTLHRVIFQLAAFSGMEMENTTRGHAWRFLDIGRRIERASNLAATVRAVLKADPTATIGLAPLLEYSDSTMTYRRRHMARPELGTTLDLLLADRNNPRSLAFQFESLRKHLARLPGAALDLPERRRFAALHALQASADFSALAGDIGALDSLLAQFIEGSWELSDVLTRHYFSHVVAQAS